ncbi:MAG: N-acetylneuraminate synthase family protein [Hansschlegelia sp.]
MVKVIAEIGCNHMGKLDTAKRMIEVAARECHADFAKFQKRNNRELLSPKQYGEPHPVPSNAYGDSYGAHREALEFTVEQHAELKAHCEAMGVGYTTSVWDMTSAQEIASLRPAFLKIPSATNLNFDLQGWLCAHYEGGIHVSTGMTTREEIDRIVAFYEDHGRAADLVLYACTSGYPVSFEDLCLREVDRLKTAYGARVGKIGFSGHHLGIAADVAALTLGAEWVERHFTLDRTWKGTDHAASLEPDGMRRLCRDLRNVEIALKLKPKELLDVEIEQRKKLKWQPGLRAAS